MKLNIDFDNKTITLLDDWNLYDLIEHVENIIGVDSEVHNQWTIKQEIKLINTSLLPQALPYSRPYKSSGN